jgi:hypothetical protein
MPSVLFAAANEQFLLGATVLEGLISSASVGKSERRRLGRKGGLPDFGIMARIRLDRYKYKHIYIGICQAIESGTALTCKLGNDRLNAIVQTQLT